jgi:hypothetical protein
MRMMYRSWLIYSLRMDRLLRKLCRFRATVMIQFSAVGQFALTVRRIVLSYDCSSSRISFRTVSYVDVTDVKWCGMQFLRGYITLNYEK